MRILIVNADDFGLCEGTNYGIISAHYHGIVTSTTMLVNMPGLNHALSLIKDVPNLGIGLHLNITLGKPLTKADSLVKDNKEFYKPKENPNQDSFDENEIYQEFRAQYLKFIDVMGRKPTHLDSHLYAHQIYPKAQKAALLLAEEIGIPLRDVSTTKYKKAFFIDTFKANDKDENDLKKLLDELNISDGISELMVHPAFIDSFLLKNSSYNLQRLVEYEVLIDKEVKDQMKIKNIVLTDYSCYENLEE